MGFQATDLALQALRDIKPVLRALSEHDSSLRDQILRAAQSVVLNLEEGTWKSGRDRANRYRIAAGSAAEVRGALRIAEALGYVASDVIEKPIESLNRVMAILWVIIGPKAAVKEGREREGERD